MKDNLGLQQYATADDVMEKLVEDYDLADFSLYWQRVLGGIHYEMQLQAFSNVNNFVMAENVSEATVATIKENSLSLPGVEIVETSTRSYEQGTVLPACAGPGGQDHRRKVEGDRRERSGDLPAQGKRLQHERRHRHFRPGICL